MALQFSTALRNARAAAIEATIGASPTLEIRSGAAPANCAAADSGDTLATIPLPADWLSAPSGGVVTKLGAWSAFSSDDGVPAHFRIKDSGGTCHMQGTATVTGGGGDMTINLAIIELAQIVTVGTFALTEPGA